MHTIVNKKVSLFLFLILGQEKEFQFKVKNMSATDQNKQGKIKIKRDTTGITSVKLHDRFRNGFGGGKLSHQKRESVLKKIAQYMKQNGITDFNDAVHRSNIMDIVDMWKKRKACDRDQRIMLFISQNKHVISRLISSNECSQNENKSAKFFEKEKHYSMVKTTLKEKFHKNISKNNISKLMKKVNKSKLKKESPDQSDVSDLGQRENQGRFPQIDGIINQNQANGTLNQERTETKYLLLEDEFKQKQYKESLEETEKFEVASSVNNFDISFVSSDNSLYCICKKSNDQCLYIECDTCKEWFHPKCIFSDNHIALLLSENQWQNVHLLCSDQIPNFFDSKPVFFHDINLNKSTDSSARLDMPVDENNDAYFEKKCLTGNSKPTLDAKILDKKAHYQNLVLPDYITDAPEKAISDSESSIDETCLSQNQNLHTLNKNISDQILYELGNLGETIDDKEKHRDVSVEFTCSFILSVDEWTAMTANRSEHRFGNNKYAEIVITKINELYDFCVPCIRCHYLRSPKSVMTLEENSDHYLEGHVDVYCSHVSCCSCETTGRVLFYSYVDKVEGVITLTGKRCHKRNCVRSRPVTGSRKQQLIENLSYEPASSVFRKLKTNLTENQNYYGSSVYAPSQAVLRNLKYKGKLTERYSSNWLISLNILKEKLVANNDSFIQEIKADPPSVTMFSEVQVRLYAELCKKDVIYLDATGSIIIRSSNKKDFQLYTLLVRNPYKGSSSLPVATYLTNQHDASSIARFLQLFLLECKKFFKTKRTPLLLMVDGSFAIWNAVLREMCGETRADYYKRCWRVATGSAEGKDLKKTFVHNCLSHSMKAAKILVKKFYSGGCYKAARFWIAKLFQSKNLNEIIEIMQSIVIITNCYKTSPLIQKHFNKLKSDSDTIFDVKESLTTADDVSEEHV